MDTGTLYVFHDTRNEKVLAVANGINFHLRTHHIFVDQHRIFDHMAGDDCHIFFDILIRMRNNHILTAQNVRRTHQNRIAQVVGSLECLFGCHDSLAGRTRNAASAQQLIETLSVFGSVDIICGSTQNIDTHICQVACQLDGSLSAELYHYAVRLFGVDDIGNVFLGQRIEVQTVAGIEVCGNGLRVVVADDCLTAHLFQCPYTVYRTVVELDTLSDTDRTGTEYDNLFLVAVLTFDELFCFVFVVIGRIEVRCLCLELACAGINHLINGMAVHRAFLTGNTLNGCIQIAVLLCQQVQIFGQRLGSHFPFQFDQIHQLV